MGINVNNTRNEIYVKSNGTEQAGSSAQVSAFSQTNAQQVSGETSYNVSDVKQDELTNIEKLYKKLSDTFMTWGISVEEAQNAGVIEKVAGKDANQLTESDLTRVEEAIKRAAKFVQAQKGELNLENLINAANKMNVATINDQYSWKTVDAEISKMEKGERSSLFQHEDLNDFMERYYNVDFDNMTKEQIQARAKELGINLSNSDDLDTLKKELKEGMLNKYFANHEFKSAAQQLDDYTKMLINTKDPEERKMFVEGVKSLYAENKEPAIQKLLASFTEIADRMDAADKLGQNIVEITNNTNPEQTENIARVITTEQSEEGARETSEVLNNVYNEIAEIIEKQEKGIELTDEEKALLEKLPQYNSLNKGKDQGYIINNNLTESVKQELLHNSLNTYTNFDEKTGSNIKAEMKDALEKYIEAHPETNITKEQLATIIENAENADVVAANSSGASSGSTETGDANSDVVLANAESSVGFAQPKKEEEVKAAQVKADEISTTITPEASNIVISSKANAYQTYQMYGASGLESYCKQHTGKQLCEEAFRKSQYAFSYLQEKAGRWLSGQSNKTQTEQLTAYGTDISSIRKYVSADAMVEANESGKAPSTTAKRQIELYAEKIEANRG